MNSSLSALFSLESLSDTLLRGRNLTLGGGRVYGGQVIAQSLAAAAQGLDGMSPHSLHGYFLRLGDPLVPIDYRVVPLRYSRSFATRQVTAIQNDKPIFEMLTSFQHAEQGLDFQLPMPDVSPPEALPQLAAAAPENQRQRSAEEMRVDIRPVPQSETDKAGRCLWLKIMDPLPNDLLLHQCVLGYISDFGLLGTAREVHGIAFREPGAFVASLDHSIWYHRPVDCNQWLLHVMECVNTGGGRGYARGRIYSRTGCLLASTTQEGVLRVADARKSSTVIEKS